MPIIASEGAASSQGFGQFARTSVPTYIEDVFSTWLYTGNGSTQTINNGIDLAGKGGLVLTKSRSATGSPNFYDTLRGVNTWLVSNGTFASTVTAGTLTSFNSSGFSLGDSSFVNASATDFVSWTFREQPKFFDVVTYTGNGSNRTIAHNLGSVPGCIIVKRTDTTSDWQVYHRSLANTQYMVLNSTAAVATDSTRWNSTTPTDTVFSLGTNTAVNTSGGTYVAYLFAHDAGGFGLTGTDNVISCGSFTGNGAASQSITLGYEPQLVLMKLANTASSWIIWDTMRGMTMGNDARLFPNNSDAENSSNDDIDPTATGFNIKNATFNGSGNTAIYIAIRRGPMRTPTTGTSVYTGVTRSGTSTTATVSNLGFAPDLAISLSRNQSRGKRYIDKLRGVNAQLDSTNTNTDVTSQTDTLTAFGNNSVTLGGDASGWAWNNSGTDYIQYFMRRAPGFFDVVCYTGTGSPPQVVPHNLGVTPELIITKVRSVTSGWYVYSTTTGTGKRLLLNTNFAEEISNEYSAVSSTSFTAGNGNTAYAGTLVSYLFASCPGISKVGSYTGNGSSQTINCGFTGGARFVMIKRTDNTGDWYVWDTARGIVSGNDPRLALNAFGGEVATDDSLDPNSTGFVVNQLADTNINVSSATYIYLAIA